MAAIKKSGVEYHLGGGIGRITAPTRQGKLLLPLQRRPAIVPATPSGTATTSQMRKTLTSVPNGTAFIVPLSSATLFSRKPTEQQPSGKSSNVSPIVLIQFGAGRGWKNCL